MEVLPRRRKRSLSSFRIISTRNGKSLSCYMAEVEGLSFSRGLSCLMAELSLVVSKLSKYVLTNLSGRIERVVRNQEHNTICNAEVHLMHMRPTHNVKHLFNKINYTRTRTSIFIGFTLKHTYWRGKFSFRAVDFLFYYSLYDSKKFQEQLSSFVRSCDVCKCARKFHSHSVHSLMQLGTVLNAIT
jgi:hypothetical protein